MGEFATTLNKFQSKALFFFDTCHSGNVLGVKEITKGHQSPVTQPPVGVPGFPLVLIK